MSILRVHCLPIFGLVISLRSASNVRAANKRTERPVEQRSAENRTGGFKAGVGCIFYSRDGNGPRGGSTCLKLTPRAKDASPPIIQAPSGPRLNVCSRNHIRSRWAEGQITSRKRNPEKS